MSRVIYLDYSATTPVNEEVLNDFIEDNKIIGNANSIHLLGRKCKDEINKASNDILKLLGLSEDEYEVIYTSGSTEANNLAIKGLLAKKSNGHIITTSLEHSSVVAPLSTIQRKGFSVEFAKNNENGLIDLLELEKSITDETVLVSIAAVSSEIGILQPIEEINQLINRKKRDNPNLIFHIDATQAIGKTKLKLDGIDMISFSGHKIYGLKGIGALIKKKEVSIYGEIQGGKSTTKYRSGTPCHPLIMSLRNSLKIALTNLDCKINYVNQINQYLKNEISKVSKDIVINSNDYCIPHILNMSVIGYNSIDLVIELEKYNIYISNHSACSSEKNISLAVYALTNDEERAKSSIRISLSHLTTIAEIDELIKKIKELV